jgi:phospholipase C
MDGFVAAYRRLGRDGTTSMGYYDGADLPYYWNVADEYTLFDHFFSSARTGPRLNAFYWVAGVPTPNGSEALPPGGYGNIPTIFDLLDARGVTWKFYVENLGRGAKSRARSSARVPLAGFTRFLDDPRLSAHIVDLTQYDTDLAAGTLPAVSYVVSGGSSESPPGRVTAGQMLIRSMVSGLQRSQYWPESAFLWTYDGWGGFYDHVPPPSVDAFGYGFRVPALLVSPYSRRGVIDHTTLDYTAALRFVEDNWGLPRLGARDTASAGLASAFDFGAPPRPPQLLGLDHAPLPDGARGRLAVYLSYGGALLFAAAAAWLPGRIRRRTRVSEEVG